MAKVLIMVRASTEKQSIEDQHNEMRDFCIQEGYQEKDMIFIEDKGASAAKVNDKYREMIDSVKDTIINDPDIDCFACWHLNRAFRTERVYVELKDFLVSRGIQMLIKNPYLKLLNPDGTINKGMELAVSLLSVLAKQDQDERIQKFKRSKHAMARKGQSVGGNTRKFGYAIDANRFFIADPQEAPVIQLAFELYSTGEYSTWGVADELEARGIRRPDGTPVGFNLINKALRCRAYLGEPDPECHDRIYPPLISQELWDKCEAIRKEHRIDMRPGEKVVLGSKLVKCKVCGGTMTSNSRHYCCCRHTHNTPNYCPNDLKLRECVVDELLWRVAYARHIDYLMDLNEDKVREYKNKAEILDQKIDALNQKIEKVGERKNRIVESYMDGLIDKKTRDSRLSKVDGDILTHNKDLTALNEAKNALLGLIENASNDMAELDDIFTLAMEEIGVQNRQKKYDIIHKHILKIEGERKSVGKRDPRTKKPNAIELTVFDVLGYQHRFLYFPKFYQKCNLYVWNGRRWVGEELPIPDKKSRG